MQEPASEQLWDTRIKQSAGQDNLGKPVSERPEMMDHMQTSLQSFFTTTHEEICNKVIYKYPKRVATLPLFGEISSI